MAISVFMAVTNVKDDNIGQNMALEKADAVDSWNEYQAGRIKLHTDEDMLAQLKLGMGTTAVNAAAVAAEMARLQKQIDKYNAKSAGLMKQAKDHEATYDALNLHDDQFDMSDALLSIGVSDARSRSPPTLHAWLWRQRQCRSGVRTRAPSAVPGDTALGRVARTALSA